MNVTHSIRPICCKVALDTAADAALRATQVAFNQAATYCAMVAWEQNITNKNTFHHIVYGATRVNFDLGAQLACCARDKAAEAVRAVRADPDRFDRKTGALIGKTCPSFRDDGSIRYDANTYTLKSLDRVSLNTPTRRCSPTASREMKPIVTHLYAALVAAERQAVRRHHRSCCAKQS